MRTPRRLLGRLDAPGITLVPVRDAGVQSIALHGPSRHAFELACRLDAGVQALIDRLSPGSTGDHDEDAPSNTQGSLPVRSIGFARAS